MIRQKLLRPLIFVMIGLLVSSCGPGQLFGPTMTPSPTSTPTPTPTLTPLPGPKAGHWEGEPSVSFEVTDDMRIQNFKMKIVSGIFFCDINIDEITIGADQNFLFGEKDTDGKLKPNSIDGKFNGATTLVGSYSEILVCGTAMIAQKQGNTWRAEWKGP